MLKKNKKRKTAENSFKTHVPEQSQNIEISAKIDVIPDKHDHYWHLIGYRSSYEEILSVSSFRS